jgi:hypothetical protein
MSYRFADSVLTGSGPVLILLEISAFGWFYYKEIVMFSVQKKLVVNA